MNRSAKGRKSEWVVRDFLLRRGYLAVFRARASKGPADLIAFNEEEVAIVAVRTSRWPSPKDRARVLCYVFAPFIRAYIARVMRGGRVEFRLAGIQSDPPHRHLPGHDGVLSPLRSRDSRYGLRPSSRSPLQH